MGGFRKIFTAINMNVNKAHKNKFILVLERTLMNNSEEHLELVVHCAHRRLLPNDSFVRDLVTILNERNIRVINNGRMFERNRVTELGKLDPRSVKHNKKVLVKMELPPEALPPPPAEARPPQPLSTEPPTIPREPSKSHKSSRARTPSPEPLAALGPLAAPDRTFEPPAASEPTTAGHKRIIVEDFVEIRPSPSTLKAKHSKKRKHKRTRTSTPESLSAEESPMLVSKRQGAGLDAPPDGSGTDDAAWTVGTGSSKVQKDTMDVPTRELELAEPEPDASTDILAERDHRDAQKRMFASGVQEVPAGEYQPVGGGRGGPRAEGGAPPADTPDDNELVQKQGGRSEEAGPVKLVMRSNLTFNLGDELFAWRRQPHLANILEEQLSLPARASKPTASAHAAGPDSSESSSGE